MERNNEVKLTGIVRGVKEYPGGRVVRLQLDIGGKWDSYAMSHSTAQSAWIREHVEKGDRVKITGAIYLTVYRDEYTGERKRLSNVKIMEIEPAGREERTGLDWTLTGTILTPVVAYTGRGIKGKFKIAVKERCREEIVTNEYTVILWDETLAKRLERETEPGQNIRVTGTLGKYAVKDDGGQVYWWPCMHGSGAEKK